MRRTPAMVVIVTAFAMALLATGTYKDSQALDAHVGTLDWEAWLAELLA